jgi:hypothetical protein
MGMVRWRCSCEERVSFKEENALAKGPHLRVLFLPVKEKAGKKTDGLCSEYRNRFSIEDQDVPTIIYVIRSAFVKKTLSPFYVSLISRNQTDFLLHHVTQSIHIHIKEINAQKRHFISFNH